MKIPNSGIVRKIYKDPVDLWCVTVVRENGGETTYIRFKNKPKVRVGQVVCAGEEL